MMGKTEGRRRRGEQRMKLLDGITNLKDMNLSKFWGMVKDREAWCAAIYGITKNQTQLSWTEWASQMALVIKNIPANAGDIRDAGCLWVGKIPWRKAWRLTPVFLPGKLHGQRSLLATVHWVAQVALVVKNPLVNTGDAVLIPVWGRFLWRRK